MDFAKVFFFLHDSSVYFIKRINSMTMILRTIFILKHFDIWSTYTKHSCFLVRVYMCIYMYMLHVLCLICWQINILCLQLKYLYDKLIRNLNRTAYYVIICRNISYATRGKRKRRKRPSSPGRCYYVKRKQIQSVVGKMFMDWRH